LGKARIQASLDLSELAREAVVGSMFPRTGSSIIVPSIRAEYLEPGLRDLRTARNLNALYPETQLLLGQHRRYFSEAEPSIVYFERAKVLNVSDPNIWFACGNAEAEAGRDAEAFENWKHSLEISPQQLPAILAEARRRYAAGVVLNRILPGNPVTLVEAADYYRREPDSYRLILERAASAPRGAIGFGSIGWRWRKPTKPSADTPRPMPRGPWQWPPTRYATKCAMAPPGSSNGKNATKRRCPIWFGS